MVASVRHFGRSSGLAPGRVYFDEVTVLRYMASFSPSTLENCVFKKYRFQIALIWRAFSNGSLLGDRFRRISVDGALVIR